MANSLCGQVVHILIHCPSKVLFTDEDAFQGETVGEIEKVAREERVEGIPLMLLLDTGSVRTLVQRDLLLTGKILVHMTSVCYLLAGRRFVL